MKRRSSVTLLIVVVLHKKTYKPLSKQCTTITVLYLVGSMSISHFYLSILYAPINRNTKTVRKLIFSSVLLKKSILGITIARESLLDFAQSLISIYIYLWYLSFCFAKGLAFKLQDPARRQYREERPIQCRLC